MRALCARYNMITGRYIALQCDIIYDCDISFACDMLPYGNERKINPSRPAGHIASKIYRTHRVYHKSRKGFISLLTKNADPKVGILLLVINP